MKDVQLRLWAAEHHIRQRRRWEQTEEVLNTRAQQQVAIAAKVVERHRGSLAAGMNSWEQLVAGTAPLVVCVLGRQRGRNGACRRWMLNAGVHVAGTARACSHGHVSVRR